MEQFTIPDTEIAVCTRLGIPLPKTSPDERRRTLMAFRNEWKLYKRKCDATGKSIVSAYPPDSPFKVYDNPVWWGDGWDGCEYGRDFDFSRPFFEQFKELQLAVPREGTTIFNSENCDYNSHIRESRNCYLNSLVAQCEDTYYSYWTVGNKDVFDSAYANYSSLCYECCDVNNCYGCVMLQESSTCTDCFFSYQLRGCKNCIFCTDLVNAEYRIFNKPCSKEEFAAYKKNLFNGSYATFQKAYDDFLKLREGARHRGVHSLNCENVSGDHLYNCKNCLLCCPYNQILHLRPNMTRTSHAMTWGALRLSAQANLAKTIPLIKEISIIRHRDRLFLLAQTNLSVEPVPLVKAKCTLMVP